MRSFASRFNKGRKFDVDTNGFQYASLADLFNANGKDFIYPVTAIYINTKGKYADAPVIATDSCFVNCPAHMCDTAREILSDVEAIEAINSGRVGFQIYTYTQAKYNRECFGINFVDM